MLHNRPYHRSESPRVLERYSTRILIGFVASLSTILVAMYVPLSLSPNEIGWSIRSADRITLSMVEEEDSRPDDGSEETVQGGPPPTRQDVPEPEAASSPDDGDSDATKTGEKQAESEEETEPHVQRVATLTAKDRIPQVVGGMGSLYLQIQYPQAAKEQGIEGRVELDFTVGTNGTVRRIRVAKSLHPLCDSAAVRALRSVTFRPAKRGGEVVPIRMRLPIQFELRSSTKVLHSDRSSSG